MKDRVLPLLGIFLVVSVVQFIGVVYLYAPIANTVPAGEPLIPRPLGFALSMALAVMFFDWVNQQMRHPVKAALTIAIAQALLVDVDYVLSGERSVAAGAASAVVLLLSWGLGGLIYRRLSERAPT